LGANYVVFTDVIADPSGNITGTWQQNPTDTSFPKGDFNGLQVIAVPKPARWVMLAGRLGLLVVIRRAKVKVS
jgi:hypothetical protein